MKIQTEDSIRIMKRENLKLTIEGRPSCAAESHKCVPRNPRETASLACHAHVQYGEGLVQKRTLQFHVSMFKRLSCAQVPGTLSEDVVYRCSLMMGGYQQTRKDCVKHLRESS